MNVEISNYSGFCYGVKRAVKIARQTASENGKSYTLGPLIHNDNMIRKLSDEGIDIIDKIDANVDSYVVIRSHGVGYDIFKEAKNYGVKLIDATCPYVKRIQNRVFNCYKNAQQIIIVGDKNHPEIIGINGWCKNTAQIVNCVSEAEKLEDKGVSCLVVQTTFSEKEFNLIVDIAKKKIKNINIYNTICTATTNRQESAKNLAKRVDAMIVVGGKNSSNSKKLYEICKRECENVFFIQSSSDLLMTSIQKYDNIGVSAGASTPDWILDDILDLLNTFKEKSY